MDTMRTYADAVARLNGRQSRKLANNTYLQRRSPTAIALKLHATDILTYTDGEGVAYNTGGWQTVTTKERMNRFGPLRIWSDRGSWYCGVPEGGCFPTTRYCYTEGLRVVGDTILGADPDMAAKNRALRKSIKKYAADFMDALERGEVPAPSGGDCWYCCLRTQDGTTLGEATPTLYPSGKVETRRNTDHLLSHMGVQLPGEDDDEVEVYYVPSLLARALEVRGASKTMWWWVGSYWAPPEGKDMTHYRKGGWGYERPRVEKALRKYVAKQLGLSV